MIVGLIQAFNEEANIADAVRSLFDAGAGRVVVVDGAWTCPDGLYFGGNGFYSTDATPDEAEDAGAVFLAPPEQHFTDGSKRDWAIRNCGASTGDHVLVMDADERIIGATSEPIAPAGHGCVILRNDKPNDLEIRSSLARR